MNAALGVIRLRRNNYKRSISEAEAQRFVSIPEIDINAQNEDYTGAPIHAAAAEGFYFALLSMLRRPDIQANTRCSIALIYVF